MGNFPNQEETSLSKNQNGNFVDKINKLSETYLQKFGTFNLYQLNEKPYDYYIQYIENLVPNTQIVNSKLLFYKNLPKNKNLVPISHIQSFRKKQRCAQFDVLRIFCTYYNFTLEDAIKLKIKQRNCFNQADAFYILKSLLFIGKFYQNQLKSKFYSGIFKTKNIFISPQGHIKIYPFNDNAFAAFINNKQSQQSSLQVTEKKISIQLTEDKIKPYIQTRDQSSIFKSSFYKSKQSFKKPKLTTTLKKQRGKGILNDQILNMKGASSQKISRNVSNTILSHQQSSQTFSYFYQKLNQNNYGSNKQDLFQLGLLMMQVFLLNQDHQYYKQKNSNHQPIQRTKNKINRQSSNTNNTLYTVEQQNDNILKNLKRLQEYENDKGQIPNVDLIYFSLKKLLPKKNFSKFIVQLIEKMILGSNDDIMEYELIHERIQKQQKSCKQIRYCLKFQNSKQQKLERYQSAYLVKNKTLNKTIDFDKNSYGINSSYNDNNRENNENKQLDSKNVNTCTKKLQDFLNYNNLSRSVVVQQDLNKDNQVLNNLKKSRKLIPHKIRSISMKLNDTTTKS